MITVATDEDTFTVDADLSMTLENLQAILEADSSIPVASQSLSCNGRSLQGAHSSLEDLGVKNDDLLLLHRLPSSSVEHSQASGAGTEQQAEALRQEILSNPTLLSQLRMSRPDIVDAAHEGASKFSQVLKAEQENRSAAYQEQMRLAAADEFDVDAQRRIEEAIRQEAVMENFGSAMEFTPESFGRVTMLYVNTEVNGHPIKAFVDSGAQATIMSPECAEKCGIMRLIDKRFAGIARGVGTAKILGRVHSAQIKLGDDLHLPCSFTIMEGRATELLFGLDMLKRHNCILDLAKNALVVHGREIRFLDEHELPAAARMEEVDEEESQQAASAGGSGPAVDAANANAAASGAGAGQSFPGRGNTLTEQAPTSRGMSWNHDSQRSTSAGSTQQAKSWPPQSMQALKDLGATDAQAKAFLDAAGGNVEVAASLLFQQ